MKAQRPLPNVVALRDVHSEEDPRKLDLERAGVTGLRYPISVRDREQGIQHTVAEIDMSVSLPHKRKGAHMSRFVEILNRHRREIDIRKFRSLCAELRKEMDADAAHVEVKFPYFIEKKAPVTGAVGLLDYSCTFGASVTREGYDLW
ncbi:MAG: GTP cyclohydrolase, FolE2/MptA family, partial [Myxococcales bacterium]